VSFPAARGSGSAPVAERDELALAMDRACGARTIDGNRIALYSDSPGALDAMLDMIERAALRIHFENYIIRNDRTGRRFADALAARAREGVRVRVLYDAFGSLGTSRGFWRRLVRAGVEVRAFHPILSLRPFEVLSRDHRKLLVTDGAHAMVGGLCVGDEWAGDPARRRLPWRDTMLAVSGPAATALDRAFGRIWRRAGAPLAPDDRAGLPDASGDCTARVVEGVPGRARVYRAVQLLAAGAAQRLWITDAYLIPPAPMHASLLDAARDGVDVRLLVPGTSDVPVVRHFTRVGYRELLRAGVRVFEYQGPMLHAKTLVADRRWARVGSSNLNVSSLLTNYELDVVVESESLADALAAQFERDLDVGREIVLVARRGGRLPARLVGTPAASGDPLTTTGEHKRSSYELGAVAVVALRRVAGGLRRAIASTAALTCAGIGALLLLFPRVTSVVLAAGTFWLALTFGLYALERRRARDDDDDGT
jgi:cardiolipin synthase A/B